METHDLKWFDLSEAGLSLSRRQERPGIYVLALEGDLPGELDDPHRAAGWMLNDAGQLVNHRILTGLKDVAATLRPFVSDDVIESSLVPAFDLRQGEKTDGVARPVELEIEEIESQMGPVASDNRERILDGVERARLAVSERRERTVEKPAMGGKSLQMWREIMRHQTHQSMLSDMDIFPPAKALVRMLMAAHREAKIELRARLQNVLQQIHDKISPAEDLAEDQISADQEALEPDLDIKDNANGGENAGNEYEAGAVDDDGTFDLFDYEEVDGDVADDLRRRFLPGVIERLAGDEKYAELAGAKLEPSAFFNDLLFSQLTAPELDGIRELPEGQSVDRMMEGIRFRSDPGIPSYLVNDAAVRIDTALSTITRALGVSREQIIPANMTVVIASKADLRDGVTGTARSLSNSQMNSSVIRVAHRSPGAFVHELGHGVHIAHDWSDAEIRELLVETDLWKPMTASIEAAQIDGRISPSTADYLSHPTEMFARAFDAAMCNEALANGDDAFESLGGSLGTTGGWEYSPLGNRDMTRPLINELRERFAAGSRPDHDATSSVETHSGPGF